MESKKTNTLLAIKEANYGSCKLRGWGFQRMRSWNNALPGCENGKLKGNFSPIQDALIVVLMAILSSGVLLPVILSCKGWCAFADQMDNGVRNCQFNSAQKKEKNQDSISDLFQRQLVPIQTPVHWLRLTFNATMLDNQCKTACCGRNVGVWFRIRLIGVYLKFSIRSCNICDTSHCRVWGKLFHAELIPQNIKQPTLFLNSGYLYIAAHSFV